MDGDTILGVLIITIGLGGLTYLVLWSRKTIERIAAKKLRTVREIVKELKHGR